MLAFLWHETNSFLSLPLLAFYTTFFRLWVFTPSLLKFVTGCSATLAFLWHETNSFLSLPLLAFYTTFFSMWVFTPSSLKFVTGCSTTPAFLWHETNSFLCLYHFWPSTRRFSVGECSPHPHWNLLRIAQGCLHICDMKLTLLVSSQLRGLLHDVFQLVSVHPHPHWNCNGLVSDACLVVTWN